MLGLAILLAGTPVLCPPESTVRELKLPNGLRVVIEERHGAPLVAIDLWVRAGSGAQRADEDGTAHFLEHMIFKGTAKRKPGEIDALFEDVGSLVTAGTTRDGAHFYATVASAFLDRALEGLADAACNASLPAEEMQRERAVILDELAQGRNDWRKQALDAARTALYPKDLYSRPILGAAESIQALKREQIQAFYKRWYVPGNAVLMLVGDIDVEAAEAAARKAFGAWPADAVPEARPLLKAAEDGDQVTSIVPTNSTKAIVCLANRGPPGNDESGIACARLIQVLLGDSNAGRLASRLLPYCGRSDWGADFSPMRGPSMLAFFAATSTDSVDAVRSTLGTEVQRLTDELVSRSELEVVKRRALGALMFEEETCAGRARSLGNAEMAGGYALAVHCAEHLKAVTPKELQEFARKWLKGGAAVILQPALRKS